MPAAAVSSPMWRTTPGRLSPHRTGPSAPRRRREELARANYVARWRGLRYALGVVLACVSIAGGAFAVLAVAGALAARTSGTTTLVLGVTPGGGRAASR